MSRRVLKKTESKFISQDGIAFSTGYNYYGQLGHQNTYIEQEKKDERPNKNDNSIHRDKNEIRKDYALGNSCDQFYPIINGLCNSHGIVQVAAGEGHTLLLDSEAQVYSFGCNRYGQLGLGDKQNRTIPSLIPSLSAISQIACGSQHSGVLNRQGQIFTWGAGNSGRLGLDNNFSNCENPEHVISLKSINMIQISFGGWFSLALAEDGSIWAWGDNTHGQLGLQVNHTTLPTCVTSIGPEKVVRVQAGRAHTIIFTSSDKIFSFGRGECGQLGVKKKVLHTPAEIKSLSNKKIDSLACGYHHSLALTSAGEIYMWGYLSKDHIGEPGLEDIHYEPISLDLSFVKGKVIKIFAGGHHSACISDLGNLYTWGYAYGGRLGVGTDFVAKKSKSYFDKEEDEDDQLNFYYNCHPTKPIPVTGISPSQYVVSSVACGGAHTVALVFPRNRSSSRQPTVSNNNHTSRKNSNSSHNSNNNSVKSNEGKEEILDQNDQNYFNPPYLFVEK